MTVAPWCSITLNRPGAVLEDLVDPRLADNDRKLPELDPLLEQVLAQNSRLLAQRQMLAAAWPLGVPLCCIGILAQPIMVSSWLRDMNWASAPHNAKITAP